MLLTLVSRQRLHPTRFFLENDYWPMKVIALHTDCTWSMLLHANETAKDCIQSQVKWQEKIPRCEKLTKDGPTDERKKDTKIFT